MKTSACIINFARGAWYPRGQARLLSSLKDTGFSGGVFAWSSEAMLGCAGHDLLPYYFKIAAFNKVASMGYRLILWCDAAVWARKPIDPLLEEIDRAGHVLFEAGWNCAQWSSDNCLNAMGVTRDEAEKMPMYMACCMGLNLNVPRAAEFLRRLTANCNERTLPGNWTNHQGEVSGDARCLGHRHDQAVGSILASKMGMPLTVGHETFFQYYNNKAGIAFQYGQSNDMSGIKDSVVMLSQGM